MRVLIMPGLYQRTNLRSNSCFVDATEWVDYWLDHDDSLHVTWLLPDRHQVNWTSDDVKAHHERVTVIETDTYGAETRVDKTFWDNGLREDHLEKCAEEILDRPSYFDALIYQNAYGTQSVMRFWSKYLGQKYTQQKPFDLIRYVHDMALPYKAHGKRPRNDTPTISAITSSMIADGNWFKANIDKKELTKYGKEWFQFSELSDISENALVDCGPMQLDHIDAGFSDEPEYVHIAGGTQDKKNRKEIVEVAEFLYQRFGIETIVTAQREVEPFFHDKEWITLHEEQPYEKYLDTLQKCDICFCATEHETTGRTFFEQAGSGQVMVALDRPWLYDQVPEDYPLITDSKTDGMKKLAAWVVSNWEEATEMTAEMMESVTDVRSTETIGEKTLNDLHARVQERVDDHSIRMEDVLEDSIAYCNDDAVTIEDIEEASTKFTDNGSKITDLFHYPIPDLVLDLRCMGYEDVGGPDPTFEKTNRWVQ